MVRADATGRVINPEDPEGVRAGAACRPLPALRRARSGARLSTYAAGRAVPRPRPRKAEMVLTQAPSSERGSVAQHDPARGRS